MNAHRGAKTRRAWLRHSLGHVVGASVAASAGAHAAGASRAPLRFVSLRHTSVLVEIDGRRVLFDPSLEPSFSAQGLFSGPDVVRGPTRLGPIDVVCVSCGDVSAFDPRTVTALMGKDADGPRFIVPDDDVAKRVRQLGFRRVRVAREGDVIATAGLRISTSPARAIMSGGLGYVVESDSTRVWHTGLVPPLEVDADAGIFAERHHPCDVAFICAWGLRLRSGGPALFADVGDAEVLARLARAKVAVAMGQDARPAGVFSMVFETDASSLGPSSGLISPEPGRWHRLR